MGWRANYDLVYQTSLRDFPKNYFHLMNMTNIFNCSLVLQSASIKHYPDLEPDHFHSLTKFSVLHFLSNTLKVQLFRTWQQHILWKGSHPTSAPSCKWGRSHLSVLRRLRNMGFLNTQRNSLCIYRRNVQIHPTIFTSTHLYHILQINS